MRMKVGEKGSNDEGTHTILQETMSVHHKDEKEEVGHFSGLLSRRTVSEDCTTQAQYREHEDVLLDAALARRTISTPFDSLISSEDKALIQNQLLDSQNNASPTAAAEGGNFQACLKTESGDPTQVEICVIRVAYTATRN